MRGRLALVSLVLSAGLAACGGGGGTASETVTPAQFRQQADALCAKHERQLDALGNPTSLDDLRDYVTKAVPILEKGNAELHSLQPPSELKADWDQAMKLQDQGLQKVRDLQTAAEKGDLASVQTISASLNEISKQSDRLATKLGLRECGTASSSD